MKGMVLICWMLVVVGLITELYAHDYVDSCKYIFVKVVYIFVLTNISFLYNTNPIARALLNSFSMRLVMGTSNEKCPRHSAVFYEHCKTIISENIFRVYWTWMMTVLFKHVFGRVMLFWGVTPYCIYPILLSRCLSVRIH